MGPLVFQASTFDRLNNWAKRPFTTDMDLLGWALFVGLLLVLVILWTRALHSVEGYLG